MPAEKYGFKPTAAQMSFGEVQAHLAEGNDYLCSAITGVAAPQRSKVPATADKIPFFGGREVSRAAAALITVDDWADHYSQVAIDLRLNGLLPPTAKRRAQ